MNKVLFRLFIIGLVLVFTGCSEDVDPVGGVDTLIDTPATYTFESRYVNGESSVSYSGQVVRNMIISAIKNLVSDESVTANGLNSLYENDDTAAEYSSTNLHSISTSRLSNKISTETVIGYGVTPHELMQGWFTDAEGLTGGNVTADGVFLNQMIGKGLLGTVSYYQGTSVYLPKMETDTNTQDCDDDGSCDSYSDMEHHWDESFGYFGASRTYATMSNADQQGSGGSDWLSEVNFDWAKYAAKRSNVEGAGDFANLIMNAYLEGRTLITNEAPLADIVAQRSIIVENWEKVVGANVIHYANDVKELLNDGGTDFDCSADASCGKYWAEMAAFVLCLQYNSYSDITNEELTELHNLTGMVPPTSANGTTYQEDLNTIMNTVGNKLGFTASQIAAF